MQMKKISLIIVCICFFCGERCVAQKRNEFGFMGGDSYYLGELNPGAQFMNNHLTYGVFYRRNIGDRISVRMSGNFASISGNDTLANVFGRKVGIISRQGEFHSNIIDLSAMCEINFLNYFIGASRYFWTPYMILGVGGMYQMSLKGSFVGEDKTKYVTDMSGVYQKDNGSVCWGKPADLTANVCFGFGFKYSVSDRIGIFGEWIMHKTFVDWLDGFYFANESGTFEQGGKVNYNCTHICNSATNDWYSFCEFGISFAFNMTSKNDCYEHLRK